MIDYQLFWEFFDYVEDGTNQITAWLKELGPVGVEVKSRLDTKLKFLAQCERLSEPQVKMRQGNEHGLLEIRFKARKVEWRPLACYGPGRAQVTLLVGAYEKNDRYHPHGVIEIALKRKEEISERGRIANHDYF